jgi:hypothetical protein
MGVLAAADAAVTGIDPYGAMEVVLAVEPACCWCGELDAGACLGMALRLR